MEGTAGPEGKMQLNPEDSNTSPGGTNLSNGTVRSAPVANGTEKNKKPKKRKRTNDISLQGSQKGREARLEQAVVKKPKKKKHKSSHIEDHGQATENTNPQKVREAELEDATMKKHKSSYTGNHGEVKKTVHVVENSWQKPLEISTADSGLIGAKDNNKDERQSSHTENHGQEIGATKSFLQRLLKAREADLNQVALKKRKKKKHKSCHIENHGQVTENAPILESNWQSPQQVREADSEQVGANKHDSSYTKHHSEETEGLLALADLRNDTHPDRSYDDELASSQLQGENAEVLLNSNHGFEDLLKETSGEDKKRKRLSEKRDQSGSKGSTTLDFVAKEDREAIRDLFSPAKKTAYIPTHQGNLPHSTIDEMDSNDEAVAFYLREYLSSPRSPMLYSTEMIGHVPGGNVSTHEVETSEERPTGPYNNKMPTHLSPPRNDAPHEHRGKNYRRIEKFTPIVNNEPSNDVDSMTGQ